MQRKIGHRPTRAVTDPLKEGWDQEMPKQRRSLRHSLALTPAAAFAASVAFRCSQHREPSSLNPVNRACPVEFTPQAGLFNRGYPVQKKLPPRLCERYFFLLTPVRSAHSRPQGSPGFNSKNHFIFLCALCLCVRHPFSHAFGPVRIRGLRP
jgi:hypothetical protein